MPYVSALSAMSAYAGTESARSTTSTQNTSSTQTTMANSSLSITDFYQLLATQLQYQDADNPMDTAEMMGQLVQTQMSQAIDQMSSAVADLTTVNLLNYATSMMGQEVTVAQVDENGNYTGKEVRGTVTGVSLGSVPTVVVNGEEYSLVQIMSVGDVPEDTGDTKKPEDGNTNV